MRNVRSGLPVYALDKVVCLLPESTMRCLYASWPKASALAANRVPIHTPSAPRHRAAASPRPSTIPPAASTGIRTASTTAGTSTIVLM